jgi:hypothetical protein
VIALSNPLVALWIVTRQFADGFVPPYLRVLKLGGDCIKDRMASVEMATPTTSSIRATATLSRSPQTNSWPTMAQNQPSATGASSTRCSYPEEIPQIEKNIAGWHLAHLMDERSTAGVDKIRHVVQRLPARGLRRADPRG